MRPTRALRWLVLSVASACAVVAGACDTDFEEVYGEALERLDAGTPDAGSTADQDAGAN